MIDLIDFDIDIMESMENIRLKANDDTNAKTFHSGYIWAEPMDIKVHLENDLYAMKNNSHGETAWNFPVGDEKAKIAFLNELVHIRGLKLLKLTNDDVEFIEKHYHDRFIIKEALDDSEYIYDAAEHAKMEGKAFASLRRTMNKFHREHTVKTVVLTEDNMQTAKEVMEAWGEGHEGRGELDTSGTEIDGFLTDHYEELRMLGTLTYINDVPSAVVMGYRISDDVCDIAETKYMPGIRSLGYVAVKEFMRTFGDRYRYFNNEEDMGIEGLREYKRCLKPCRMITLYNVYLKGEGE